MGQHYIPCIQLQTLDQSKENNMIENIATGIGYAIMVAGGAWFALTAVYFLAHKAVEAAIGKYYLFQAATHWHLNKKEIKRNEQRRKKS